jgi:CTP:phosphocholine cytidylyltransferase-like protein
MKYIILCGGEYNEFKTPKQLIKIKGEVLVERTIRQLRENGIIDIAISTNNENFNYLDVEIIHHKNEYKHNNYELECSNSIYSWLNAFVLLEEPCCYLLGDVYFSYEAIKRIVNDKVEDTMFYCTCDGTDKKRNPLNVKGREPFAYKVENWRVFHYAIKKLKQKVDEGYFKGNLTPISWHVYRFLNGYDIKPTAKEYTEINNIFQDIGDYVVIDDYTSDIDTEEDIKRLNNLGVD